MLDRRIDAAERRVSALAIGKIDWPVDQDAVPWVQSIGLTLDPWQTDVLRSPARSILLNCARQTGKSTVAALSGLFCALSRPGALILLVSPSLRQSSELYRGVVDFYHRAGDAVPSRAESSLRLELANGSRIISLPGSEDTIRGYSSVDVLIVDEAARVGDGLYYSLRPMLAVSGGRLLALSTPDGKRGWWWEEWDRADPGWLRVRVPASECPRISAHFLAEERRRQGARRFAQEYECEFGDPRTAPFTWDMVRGAVEKELEEWNL